MAPDTPRMESADPPKNHPNTQDLLFVRQMAIAGKAEADVGKLAESRGKTKAVQDFGKRMVSDHAKVNEKLLGLPGAKQASVPKDLDPDHQRMRSELEKASEADFDVLYLTNQVQDHQKTANLLLWEVSHGQSNALTQYAADTLPLVMEHLDLATEELRTLIESRAHR
jgi:putative membrane protein